MDHEAGGHRVQRIPEGERRGRVHSSTVTVVVVDPDAPARGDAPWALRAVRDFAVEWFSGSGSGGQHRNKHANCARIRHLPTGIVRTSQARSRETSRREAMEALLAELDRMAATARRGGLDAERRAQAGSGERSDKRRTWRFQDGRVVDHVTGRAASCAEALRGRLDLLWR